MAGLVQHPHHGLHEVRLVIARGDSHVVGHAAAERMQRDVQAAMVEVEADRPHQAPRQGLLPGQREGSLGRLGGRTARLALLDLG
jgi:hypothetical protein